VREAEFLALMGPSGSGKSTLLNLIGGLDRPTSGTVQIGADRVDQLSDRQLAAWRARHIGFVFQFYNLLPALSAERNIELPLLLTHLNKAARRQHVAAALEAVGLTHRAKHHPAHALRRRTTTRRHRPRHRHRSHRVALRRTHRRPRPQVRR
jgi:putative ABC transport system ATP-binding protein